MIKDLTVGQYVPGTSFLHQLDPRTKLILMTTLIIALFRVKSVIGLGLLGSIIILGMFFSRIPWFMYQKNIKALRFILLFTFIVTVWGQPDIYLGIYVVVRLILIIFVTAVITYTTSPIALTDGLESLAWPLTKLNLPVHELAMIITIALRFIPTLVEEGQKLVDAQRLRGVNFEQKNLWKRAKAYTSLLVPLFISSLKRADELAIAMESRAYTGGNGRTKLRELKFTNMDILLISLCLLYIFKGFWIIGGKLCETLS